MGIAFDAAPDRPENIDAILNGLDRYNPETTTVFQDYVTQQCEDRTYDCYANLALLKLYVAFGFCRVYLICLKFTAHAYMLCVCAGFSYMFTLKYMLQEDET